MWWITCPNLQCNHHAPMEDFEPSLCDECTCPKCGCGFEVDLSSYRDDDEEDDE